jgi:hypothetical protein
MSTENITSDPKGDTILLLDSKYGIEALQMPSPQTKTSEPLAAVTITAGAQATSLTTLEDDLNNLSLSGPTAVAPTTTDKRNYTVPGSGEVIADPESRYLVSSSRLRTASPYFESIFKLGFVESNIGEDGKYHFVAKDFHPEALTHVLNIVHFQGHKVFDEISLEMLAFMCVVVDYYDMKQAILPWSSWFFKSHSKLEEPSPKKPFTLQEHMLWLYVSPYLGLEDTLKSVASKIVFQCPGFTQDFGLPGLDSLLNALFEFRSRRIPALKQDLEYWESV